MTLEKKQYLVVMALIRNHEEKILMQKRVDPEPSWAYGKWEFPGGGVEWGESPEEALQREMQEEIGCNVKIGSFIPAIASVVRPDDKGGEFHALITGYECTLPDGAHPAPSDQEVGAIQWFSDEEIKALDHLPGTKMFLEKLDKIKSLR